MVIEDVMVIGLVFKENVIAAKRPSVVAGIEVVAKW